MWRKILWDVGKTLVIQGGIHLLGLDLDEVLGSDGGEGDESNADVASQSE
jgi:hypothetical protein